MREFFIGTFSNELRFIFLFIPFSSFSSFPFCFCFIRASFMLLRLLLLLPSTHSRDSLLFFWYLLRQVRFGSFGYSIFEFRTNKVAVVAVYYCTTKISNRRRGKVIMNDYDDVVWCGTVEKSDKERKRMRAGILKRSENFWELWWRLGRRTAETAFTPPITEEFSKAKITIMMKHRKNRWWNIPDIILCICGCGCHHAAFGNKGTSWNAEEITYTQ